MSASVPALDRKEDFRRIPDAALEIEQAVVSLTRAVLSEGGVLVFGGHPAISPLVATVAGEYRQARSARAPGRQPPAQVQIYQSKIFLGHANEETLLMFRLGLAEVHWIDKEPGEDFDDPRPAKAPRFPLSLRRMRTAMIGRTDLDSMVAIGGMEGVQEEVRMFKERHPDLPCYVLKHTGGACLILGEQGGGQYDIVDDRVIAERDEWRRQGPGAPEDGFGRRDEAEAEAEVVPYPLIMQTIVEELARGRG